MKGLDLSEAARVFYALEHWFAYGPDSATLEARQRQAVSRHRHERVASATAELQAALADSSWDSLDVELLEEAAKIKLGPLTQALERLAQYADRVAAPSREKRKRGPPSVEWRDALISLVHTHYPPPKRTVSTVSHLEKTIAMLLGFLGAADGNPESFPESLHKQIVRTLRRAPRAPFILQMDESEANEPRSYLPWSADYRAPGRRT